MGRMFGSKMNMRFSTFCVVVALAYAASEEDSSTAYETWASSLSETYKNGVDEEWNEGHHGWDVDADWLQSGPNNVACPLSSSDEVSVTSEAQCQNAAEARYQMSGKAAYYYAYKSSGSVCRVSATCKTPEQLSGWKIYATGLACSVPTLAKYPNAACNVAKCRGSTQDNSNVAGDLECGYYPWRANKGNGNPHRANKSGGRQIGADCIDNMSAHDGSKAKVYIKNDAGWGKCVNLGDQGSFMGRAEYVPLEDKDRGSNGIYSKWGTTQVDTRHTGTGDKRTSVIWVKRTRCNSIGRCVSFKTGFCVKCPYDVWPYDNLEGLHDVNLQITTAASGPQAGAQGKMDVLNQCLGDAFGGTANSASAGLQSSYSCSGEDDKKAQKMLGSG